MSSEEPKAVQARYSGTCGYCGYTIQPGDKITYDSSYSAEHVGCRDIGDPLEPEDADDH